MSFTFNTVFLLFASCIIALRTFLWEYEDGKDKRLFGESKRLHDSGILPDGLLYFFIFALFLIFLLAGKRGLFLFLEQSFTEVWFAIGIYYALLIVLLPLLHKIASAKICAFLWLLPNFTYVLTNWLLRRYMDTILHVFVINIPYPKLLAVLWFLGFAVIFTYKLWEHYSFRKKLLEDATEIIRGDVYDLFITKKSEMGLNDKDKIRLYLSDQVESPLTIGIFRDSICMVLPPRSFTKEELNFIFRHEMIHISREDARCKLFFTVCLAIFWFNPLMWIGFKKCRDDLELSCDETVLAGLDKEDRKEYARLVLTGKGNDKGFSSCLSAKASTLRYRLKCVVEPKKHHFGSVLVGILFFILAFTMESFTFASSGAPNKEDLDVILTAPPEYIRLEEDGVSEHFEACDVKALAAFMKDLDCYRLHSSMEKDYSRDCLEIWNDTFLDGFTLYDHYLILSIGGEESFYYMKDGVDFEALGKLISQNGKYQGDVIDYFE